MQRKAVHGGHIEHMDAGHQRRDAPQTSAPEGERVKSPNAGGLQSLDDAAASPARLRLGICHAALVIISLNSESRY